MYLVDTSALARLREPSVAAKLEPLIARGLAGTCSLLDIEAGYTAKSAADYEQLVVDRRLLYSWYPVPEDVFLRVQNLQSLLAERGIHRGVGIPDMIIACTAAIHRLTVLHYDHDFDLIGSVTHQSTEWIVPQGSVS